MQNCNDGANAESEREMTEAEEREQRDRYEEQKCDVRRDGVDANVTSFTLDCYIAENMRKTAEIKRLEAEVRRLQGELAAAKRGGKARRW